jgi:hypothetical protein
MRSTYAIHLSLLETIAMNPYENIRTRNRNILEARKAEREAASRRVRIGVLAFIVLAIVGGFLLGSPTL